MKYDGGTIGTATPDVFDQSAFRFDRRGASEKNRFPDGEAQCFALGGKVKSTRRFDDRRRACCSGTGRRFLNRTSPKSATTRLPATEAELVKG